ncbi:NRDE family protein [Galbibacter mesophilus]|uniref:NRDE family protein n=1 Tax=Galbibacter mesophilus TaxID=379069 RepID=UPI00191F1785|nr:NRDE family protein [Galbibacter mesophilus]MCM5663279.1 NRDE family protein [Galbibacter mesophilus]
MCTVSFIPKNDGFYLTSNRDEDPLRETLPPQKTTLKNGVTLEAPIDKEKRGSWIATDNQGKVACILNGGFELHERQLPYAKSRGAFVFEAFEYDTFLDFMDGVNLNNIEPFTLILVDSFLQVLVWDGKKKHIQLLSKEIPHLWSSSTLYSPEIHERKLEIFDEFLQKGKVTAESILALHGIDGDDEFVLNLPYVKTVSTTQVIVNSEKAELTYFDRNLAEIASDTSKQP